MKVLSGLIFLALVLAEILFPIDVRAEDARTDVDPKRVAEIAGMLSDGLFAFGPKIGDRAAWGELAKKSELRVTIATAEQAATRPIPDLPDELFLEYSRDGNRENYQNKYFDRTNRVEPLVIAECIENRGRFIAAIEKLVAAFDSQKTWMLPAHDGQLRNFHGKARDIDLFSSALACDLASAEYLLGDSLDVATREMIDRNVRQRVLDPFREMVTGKRTPNGWLRVTNNWNAVCLGNVLGTALATLSDRDDRAIFAAAAEKDSMYYLSGFDTDGYCVEGLGYWNYGFGHYIRLCELLYRATNGKLDCFSRAKVKEIAGYPQRFMIADGVYPPYGDAHPGVKPWKPLVDFVDRRFGLASPTVGAAAAMSSALPASLTDELMMACPNSAATSAALPSSSPALRNWFDKAGVLTCRPGARGGIMGVSIKGGRNGVSHGHDDLGSFVLAVDKTLVLTDPGSEVYTARTFGANRYRSNVINSFGHSVPLVAGQLQISAAWAQAKIVKVDFSDDVDTITMDLTSAYVVPGLRWLQRTFVYDRRQGGFLTIEDECHFNTPQAFGIQYITFGGFEFPSANELVVQENSAMVRIGLDAGAAVLKIGAVSIHEDLPDKGTPVHISVDFAQPATDFRLKSTIRVGAHESGG
jgi:hypothetical protein